MEDLIRFMINLKLCCHVLYSFLTNSYLTFFSNKCFFFNFIFSNGWLIHKISLYIYLDRKERNIYIDQYLKIENRSYKSEKQFFLAPFVTFPLKISKKKKTFVVFHFCKINFFFILWCMVSPIYKKGKNCQQC